MLQQLEKELKEYGRKYSVLNIRHEKGTCCYD